MRESLQAFESYEERRDRRARLVCFILSRELNIEGVNRGAHPDDTSVEPDLRDAIFYAVDNATNDNPVYGSYWIEEFTDQARMLVRRKFPDGDIEQSVLAPLIRNVADSIKATTDAPQVQESQGKEIQGVQMQKTRSGLWATLRGWVTGY